MDAATAAATPDLWQSLLPFVVLFAIFYFLVIYPQQRQAKKLKEMTNALKNGDRIVTNGGIFAEVVRADENEEFIKAEISKGVVIRLERSAVIRKIEPDEAKN